MPEDTNTDAQPVEAGAPQAAETPDTGYSWADATGDAGEGAPSEPEADAEPEADDEKTDEDDAPSEEVETKTEGDDVPLDDPEPTDGPGTVEPQQAEVLALKAKRYDELEAALADPEMAQDVLNQLAEMSSRATQRAVKPTTATVFLEPPKDGWLSGGEEALATAVGSLTAQVNALMQQNAKQAQVIESMQTRTAEQEREAQLSAKVDQTFEKVRDRIAARYSGFRVSKEQVRAAIQAFPDKQPGEATAAHLADALFRHGARIGSKRGEKGPTLPGGTVGKKGQVRDTGKAGTYGWAEAVADVEGL